MLETESQSDRLGLPWILIPLGRYRYAKSDVEALERAGRRSLLNIMAFQFDGGLLGAISIPFVEWEKVVLKVER